MFPLDLKEAGKQALFGVRGLKEIGQAMLAFSRGSAALQLLTETNENSQLQLIAFDLSLQVVYMSFSGFRVLLSMTPAGKGAQAAG